MYLMNFTVTFFFVILCKYYIFILHTFLRNYNLIEKLLYLLVTLIWISFNADDSKKNFNLNISPRIEQIILLYKNIILCIESEIYF
jgi:hypothetical protein